MLHTDMHLASPLSKVFRDCSTLEHVELSFFMMAAEYAILIYLLSIGEFDAMLLQTVFVFFLYIHVTVFSE